MKIRVYIEGYGSQVQYKPTAKLSHQPTREIGRCCDALARDVFFLNKNIDLNFKHWLWLKMEKYYRQTLFTERKYIKTPKKYITRATTISSKFREL